MFMSTQNGCSPATFLIVSSFFAEHRVSIQWAQCSLYSSVPGHKIWQIETAACNLAGFFHFFYKPAGSDLGRF